ncbi:MAG TPA: hypothetical protein VI670_27925 [Thermoanaerobaculia bacterium]
MLETPRIYFRGEVSWDPITTNNTCTNYDEINAETIFPPAVNDVAAFRQQAIQLVPTGNWNPGGTHRTAFFNSAISGADLGNGLEQDDPFAGSPAKLLGMLVDLEPFGTYSSQIFFDTVSFGIDGGCRIVAERNARFTDRYLNFNRNPVGAWAGIGSAVWQTCFAKGDRLRIDVFNSPALGSLRRALDDDGVLGLTVQFNVYRTIFYDVPATSDAQLGPPATQLMQKLNGGGFQPNPARSKMVGVIGLWRRGESMSEPCGRTLVAQNAGPPGQVFLGTAQARLAGSSVVLDLSNTTPETGLDLTKKDYGDLTLAAVPSGGDPIALATIPYKKYDKEAYERTSGIVTLPIGPEAATLAASADLCLLDSANQVQLAETALRALPLVPNLYMNQEETQTARFQVYDRGVPAGGGIPLAICAAASSGGSVQIMFNVTTEADGTVSFPIDSSSPRITAYVPLPGMDPAQLANGINPQVNTFMFVRILPANNNLARIPPTWENVYNLVLSNWHAMAPCMDNWLNLGDEAQVRSFAPLLKKLTNEASFENFLYMPVTRDLSRGARTLLYNFLDSPPSAAVAKDIKAPEQMVNFASASHKMRP